MNYQYIKIEEHDRYCILTLNRKDVYNAFNEDFILELTEFAKKFKKQTHFQLLLIQSSAKHFCAGADLNWMKKMKDYSQEENFADSFKLAQMFEAFDDLDQSIIGVVNGHALGGGVGIVSICDYVLSARHAQFAFSEVRLGLIPAVISPFVLNKISLTHARAWFFSGERFDAQKATEMGLVHELCNLDELDDRKNRLVASFLKAAPQTSLYCKKYLRELVSEKREKSLQMQFTANAIAQVRIKDEALEGMQALLEKRKANWME